MATVQITFTDNSDNEEKFTAYRSDSTAGTSPTGLTAEKVFDITWNTTTLVWDITSGAVDTASSGDAAVQVGSATTAPSNTGQVFIVTYTESNAGDYKYGVEAENAIGKSTLTVSSEITIT
jgi:hypothetical protein